MKERELEKAEERTSQGLIELLGELGVMLWFVFPLRYRGEEDQR